MNARLVGRGEISRPTPSPLTSSVLDHARAVGTAHVITQGFGYTNDAGLWPSYNCMDLLTPTATCANPQGGDDFEWNAPPWMPGFTFALRGGVQCRAIGLDVADQEAETRRVFERSEGRGIERALVDVRFIASAEPGSDDPVSPYPGEWDAPEDITPSSGVSLPVALALLEGNAAATYNGLPWIHMPRAASTLLLGSGHLVYRDALLFTKNGSRVAVGGGYDSPGDLDTGLWEMWATGEVYIEMANDIGVHTAHVTPGMFARMGSDDTSGLLENGVITVAQRQYRVALDCLSLSVTGKAF